MLHPHLNCLRALWGALFLAAASVLSAQPASLVSLGSDGKLVYTPTAKGDVVPDYSGVGYRNSEVDLPDPATYPRIIPIFPEPGDR
ncbi:MAG: hypothetical protein MUE42_12960, partial [Opitutaceae bacterium]|nr:hypothetical protein [Opitutaceae bacterium]